MLFFAAGSTIWFRSFVRVRDMEKVIVLLGVYNGAKYLQQQLDSLYRQQGVEVSILARDDGSTDESRTILEQNAKAHTLTWFSTVHRGVADGFYELMEKACEWDADYYAFCDQDDVWDEDKLITAVSQLKHCKLDRPALYYCGQRLVDQELHFLSDHYLNDLRSLKTRFVLSDFAGCTGVFNRALLDEVITFKPDYMLMHDTWVLRVCLGLGGEVIVDPTPHMSYRQHPGNAIGLNRGVLSTIRQVKQYVFSYQVERVTKELIKGYGDRLVPEYKEAADWILRYRTDRVARKKLLDKTEVDFCSRGLNLTYWCKIFLKRL